MPLSLTRVPAGLNKQYGGRPIALGLLRLRLRICIGVIASLLLGLAPLAQAQGLDQGTQREVTRLLTEKHFDQAQALLLSHEIDLADNPEFNYLLGITALKAGNTGLAQSALERVVLQNPNFAGAWLDLAIASEANGDLDGARTALETFIQRFGIPQALKSVVAGLQQRFDTAARGKRRVHGELGLDVGYASNANNGFTATSLPLTIGNNVIELPLDPSLRPRGANFAEGSFFLRGQIDQNEQLGWYFSGRERRYQTVRDADLRELTLGLSARQPQGGAWQTSYDLGLQNVALGLRRLFNEMRLSGQAEHPLGQRCSLALGGQFEGRRNAPASGIAANLYWLHTGLACQGGLLPGLQLSGLARFGLDNPADVRAGGQTQRQELLIQGSLPLDRVWLDASWQWARAADREGYSPLIDHNIRRTLNRSSWQLAMSTPLTPQVRATLSLEGQRQHSNIRLFEQTNTAIRLGLRYLF